MHTDVMKDKVIGQRPAKNLPHSVYGILMKMKSISPIRSALRTFSRATGSCLTVGILGLWLQGAHAGEVLDRAIHLDIPANTPLEDSLIEWGHQAGMAVMMNTTVVAHHVVHQVRGTLSAREALLSLLRGTGLTYSQSGDRIRVFPLQGLIHPGVRKDGTEEDLDIPVSAASTSTIASIADNDESGPTSTDTQSTGLQQIVVTAERREESIERVPISITALSQQTMDDLHVEKLADLATLVPGLYNTPIGATGPDFSFVAIRGIASGNNAPTTQFYIDETPIAIRQMQGAGNSGSPQPLIFDLDRVEVLRGPQGTLFGASAMGGVIRFITPQPSLDASSGLAKADVSYTDKGDPNYELGAAYGGPVVPGVAGFRVSAWFQSTGGFIDQEDPYTGTVLKKDANSSSAYVIRPAFSVQPSEGFTITPAVFIQHKHSDNADAYWLTDLPDQRPDGQRAWGGILQPVTDDLRVPSLAIKYNSGGLTFQSDTSYLDRQEHSITDFTDLMESYVDPVVPQVIPIPGLSSFENPFLDVSSTRAWQQEFRLSSEDAGQKLNWTVGAYYRRAVSDLKQLISTDSQLAAFYGLTEEEFFGYPDYVYDGQSLSGFQDYRTTDESKAIFGDISVNIMSGLKADVGVRIERQEVLDQDQVTAGGQDGTVYTHQVLPDQRATPVTPRASLTYQFTDHDMVYASAARGFRPGGGNSATAVGNDRCDPSLEALGLTSVPKTFNSDSLWSYEIGTKDGMFEEHLSVEASAYFIKWTDIQTQTGLPSCSVSFTANRGEAISKGFDLQLSTIITDGLKVGANLGYTDAYYPHAAYGAPQSDGTVPVLNVAGQKLAPIIPWTAAVIAQYSRDMSRLWPNSRYYVRADYRWQDTAYNVSPLDTGYDPTVDSHPNAAFSVLNVRAGIVHGGWDVSAYVNNATNSDPLIGYTHAQPTDPLYRATAIQPLTAGATLWYRF